MIAITLNGEEQRVPEGNVAVLLDFLDLPRKKVAVERNLEIVPRSQYADVALSDGDRIEIVQFVGGG